MGTQSCPWKAVALLVIWINALVLSGSATLTPIIRGIVCLSYSKNHCYCLNHSDGPILRASTVEL